VKKRARAAHVRAYLLVSLGLVALWALSGAGYFWPVWPIMGWGIGVVSHTAGWRKACARGKQAPTS
jgi:ABC-type phosphate transport system auxiliary subunit